MDGLKISQRKIVFAAFKRNLTKEIRVAQFSAYVSEHSSYHHGEASLNAAIVGMAQNFVGSNNINLFVPNGQFGTRLQGGKDSASERYIFTLLNKITRTLFPVADDYVLEYLNDDGVSIEPVFYAPIIPMILVNGSKGIGTGFSTEILCYNPLQIIEYLQTKLYYPHKEDHLLIDFVPYYEGFKGTITKLSDSKFLVKGSYEVVGPDKIRVTELPVGYWTEDFKELLEHWIAPGEDKDKNKIPPMIRDYEDMSKDTNVDFTINLVKGKLEELQQEKGDHGCNGLEKLLKLYTTNSTTNMHLFDAKDTLQKYDKVSDIIDAYFDVRLQLYQARKEYMIHSLHRELVVLTNKARYIQENLDSTIDLRRKSKEFVTQLLQSKGYAVVDEDEDYKYLVKMPMDSVTEENVVKLNTLCASKEAELHEVQTTSIESMWLRELATLKDQYLEYQEERNRVEEEAVKEKEKTKKRIISSSSSSSSKKIAKKA
jgi:DNA topoisomerase-2